MKARRKKWKGVRTLFEVWPPLNLAAWVFATALIAFLFWRIAAWFGG